MLVTQPTIAYLKKSKTEAVRTYSTELALMILAWALLALMAGTDIWFWMTGREKFVSGVLSHLPLLCMSLYAYDPTGQYSKVKELRENAVANKSLFEAVTNGVDGIGVRIARQGNQIVVVDALEGSPSSEAGILHGDVILAVDNRAIEDLEADAVVNLISGAPGTHVSLTVARKGIAMPLKFDLVRANYLING